MITVFRMNNAVSKYSSDQDIRSRSNVPNAMYDTVNFVAVRFPAFASAVEYKVAGPMQFSIPTLLSSSPSFLFPPLHFSVVFSLFLLSIIPSAHASLNIIRAVRVGGLKRQRERRESKDPTRFLYSTLSEFVGEK